MSRVDCSRVSLSLSLALSCQRGPISIIRRHDFPNGATQKDSLINPIKTRRLGRDASGATSENEIHSEKSTTRSGFRLPARAHLHLFSSCSPCKFRAALLSSAPLSCFAALLPSCFPALRLSCARTLGLAPLMMEITKMSALNWRNLYQKYQAEHELHHTSRAISGSLELHSPDRSLSSQTNSLHLLPLTLIAIPKLHCCSCCFTSRSSTRSQQLICIRINFRLSKERDQIRRQTELG